MTDGLSRYEEALLNGVEAGLRDISQKVVNEGNRVIRDEAFDEGTLHDSAEVRQGGKFDFQPIWTADHSDDVHFGQEAHRPPFQPIFEWVGRKLGLSGEQQYAVTEVVRDGIEENGTQPVPYAQRAVSATEAEAEQIFNRRVKEHTDAVKRGGP